MSNYNPQQYGTGLQICSILAKVRCFVALLGRAFYQTWDDSEKYMGKDWNKMREHMGYGTRP